MNIDKKLITECQSQCLNGKCPFNKCIKYKSYKVTQYTNDVKMQILHKSFGIELVSNSKGIGIAVDLGTTTIVAALYEMQTAGQFFVVSGVNRQVVFGRDIISRIKYCADHENGMQQQSEIIIRQLNEMISVLCDEAAIDLKRINEICISGNTIMLHLLLDISPVSMGTYPFEPKSLFGIEINSRDIGLIIDAQCYIPPCVSSFVGADIVCGLTALNFENDMKASFIDIGTNGEVATVNNGSIYVSATAAGPAFEGVHITCGMAAAPGAISHIKFEDEKLKIETIDDIDPVGLTGSGLTDAIATFVKIGEIEQNGRIVHDAPHFMEFNSKPSLSIVDGIFITQKDIREFQTAKSAICAGIITLIKAANENIKNSDSWSEKLFLAGGFGNYLNVDNSIYIGLIPKNFEIISVGNTSLTGAALLMMNHKFRVIAERIANKSKVIDLSMDPIFMDKYVECMSFTAF